MNRNNRNYRRNNYNKDRRGYRGNNRGIDDSTIKEKILDYIYDNVDISLFRYKIIDNEDVMHEIRNNYILSPNYNGTNCLLVFIKIYNRFYSYIIDRKTLSYNRHQIKIDNVSMIPIKIRFDKNIYKGTIMDGVLLNKENNKNVFIINDTYHLCGNSLITSNMKYKNINIKTFIEEKMVTDHIMNDTTVVVNEYYNLNSIKKLVNGEFKDLVYNTHIKGISFYPPSSGLRLIYLYSNSAIKSNNFIETVEKEEKNISEIEVEIEDNKTAIFEMRPTDIVDVYKLFLLIKIKTKHKKIVKSKKIDIAYIPTSECSQLCKNIIQDKKKVLVECSYNNRMKKWIPIKKSDAKRPNFIEEVYTNEL